MKEFCDSSILKSKNENNPPEDSSLHTDRMHCSISVKRSLTLHKIAKFYFYIIASRGHKGGYGRYRKIILNQTR